MTRHRTPWLHPHRWMVWVALAVALFAAMAPTVSRAIARAQTDPASGTEICTSTGPQWLVQAGAQTQPTNSTESPAGQDSVLHVDHCPFCLQTTDRGAAPPPQLPPLFLVQGGYQACPVWQAFFFSNPVFWVPPLRGPPLPG